ncbi:hypothetical protein AYO38_06165 [bacterium SCGC AG-212-C10]|nr:hypothetical protein AYO38_06165 [bacterium SCGC AG-212-C10]
MAFDVFALRDRLVNEYREYVSSFINIMDDRVREAVAHELDSGELWPDSVLQLNPAFEAAEPLGELADQGVIREETARFFGRDLRLHRHQRAALEIALRSEPYVVTTGTGSGKSLTYLIPIVDSVFRDDPARHSVRAIVVYPMNALINSQELALEEFKARNWPDAPIRFSSYTGSVRNEKREAIQQDPPHILLTNYVMLEYMLLRPAERTMLETATRDLRVLAVDELHFYRGRQGADVAMLMRRLQEKARREIVVAGTSATIASGGTREERLETIAGVASTFFGVPVPPANVVEESLRRIAAVPMPTGAALVAAVQQEPPVASVEAVETHPLTAWAEDAFGLRLNEDGQLVRRPPQTIKDVVARLAATTGMTEDFCGGRIRALLDSASEARIGVEQPVFAFRLHQWLGSGGAVYSEIGTADERRITMEAGYVGREGTLLYPLAFCRECGQEYYSVVAAGEESGQKLLPRALEPGARSTGIGREGYLTIDDGEIWSEDEDLPDHWYVQRKAGPVISKDYAEDVPSRVSVARDGTTRGAGVPMWFQPRPLLMCIRCRAVYDRRESEFRKLSTLSQVGRSTATTVGVASIVQGLEAAGVDPSERKVLSFTDNRQDASLQAGHLNDFVQVVRLRAAIVEALERHGTLTHADIGERVFDALNPDPQEFVPEGVTSGPGYLRARQAMIDLLEYRAIEDLARAWRVAQPNLEQCGLLTVEYDGLDALAADDTRWVGAGPLATAAPERRLVVLQSFLDYLRGRLVIEADALRPEGQRTLRRSASASLVFPWAIEERDNLKLSPFGLLPDAEPPRNEHREPVRLSPRSVLGQYLANARTWGDRGTKLTADEVLVVINRIIEVLRGHALTVERHPDGREYGVRIRVDAIRWRKGSGTPSMVDAVRPKALYFRRETKPAVPNAYFKQLYSSGGVGLRRLAGREHTGAVTSDDRIKREHDFSEGTLPALFCSPTMELGVDIRTLNAVHLRNIPPTPANYAQRSGRAGRGGRPALIAAFAAKGNAHDQYFYRQRQKMISGVVDPSRMDLTNRELLEAHLHSTWLSIVGLGLESHMYEVLDLDRPEYPLSVNKAQAVTDRARHEQRAIDACLAVVARVEGLTRAPWFSAEWVERVVREAPATFNLAFGRWRQLYGAAVAARASARNDRDAHGLSKFDREQAERRVREAQREIDLLLNEVSGNDNSDFYPYRYLAAEGFLPGYNFPRLPLRAFVSVGERSNFVDRARFLGLSEFAPQNTLYYEGRRHVVEGLMLRSSEITFTSMRFCKECGYAQEQDADLCRNCRVVLDATSSDLFTSLLEQPTARTRVAERISSEEEDRTRTSFDIGTYYEFEPHERRSAAIARDADGEPLLQLLLAPAARLWRINRGRTARPRRQDQGDGTGPSRGFRLDRVTGRWLGADDAPETPTPNAVPDVMPYVTDSRNLAIVHPVGPARERPFLVTLLHALRRGIQVAFQVEQQEVSVELIGSPGHERLLLWESAEGGTGVSERLFDAGSLAHVATQALRLCHFDPATGEEDTAYQGECVAACYECLLTYSNQLEHRHIDRQLVREFLLAIASGSTEFTASNRSRDEQYAWLLAQIDPASTFERAFVDFLYRESLQLPDRAQVRPAEDVMVQADFAYDRDGRPSVCVFVDGPQHTDPQAAARDTFLRSALEAAGIEVLAITSGSPLSDQVAARPDLFGRLKEVRSGSLAAVVRPGDKYSNVTHLRRILEKSRGILYWADPHFERKAFEELRHVEPGHVASIRIVSFDSDDNRARKIAPAKEDFKRLRQELTAKGISIEWRATKQTFHDRFIVADNHQFNIPPVNTIFRGDYSEINPAVERPPVEVWFESGKDALSLQPPAPAAGTQAR